MKYDAEMVLDDVIHILGFVKIGSSFPKNLKGKTDPHKLYQE
jgi:hypothetical protein